MMQEEYEVLVTRRELFENAQRQIATRVWNKIQATGEYAAFFGLREAMLVWAQVANDTASNPTSSTRRRAD